MGAGPILMMMVTMIDDIVWSFAGSFLSLGILQVLRHKHLILRL